MSKNTTTLFLMISSLILLVILQVFWLRSSYEKAFYDFRRESNMLFRATVLEMQDSLLAKNIEPIPAEFTSTDSARAIFTVRTDSVNWDSLPIDSTRRMKKENARVQIIVERGDTVTRDLLRVASKVQHLSAGDGGAKGFFIKIDHRTLNTDTIGLKLRAALDKADIRIPFVVCVKIEPEEEPFIGLPSPRFKVFERRSFSPEGLVKIFSDSLETEPVRLNPLQHYTASFFHVRRAIISEIAPQILFSAFITIVITGAFFLMFRNLRAQQRLMELKNDFISNVTHELKTPIATVSVALEALKNFKAMDDSKLTEEYLEIAQRELDRLSVMTEKVLKASVFESKGIEFTPEKIDFDELLQQVLESSKALLEKRDAKVNVTRNGTNFNVFGSATHLTSVIHNLLDNALKYSPDKPVINIELKENDQAFTFTIADQGMGIPEEYQKKIFEKFFRVPTGDVHNIKGYGLGLSHVASIVKSHNGRIDVTSEPGKGSQFTVTLRKPTYEFKISVP